MSWLSTVLTIFHVLVCIFLILVVLLQQGKSADWSGAFGGGSSQAAFGARAQGTILSRATTAAAVIFMLTSLALTILISSPGGSSVIREGAKTNQPVDQTTPAPATPPATEQPVTPAPAPAPEEKK
jgi:preprotein translocase subunit SecG